MITYIIFQNLYLFIHLFPEKEGEQRLELQLFAFKNLLFLLDVTRLRTPALTVIFINEYNQNTMRATLKSLANIKIFISLKNQALLCFGLYHKILKEL